LDLARQVFDGHNGVSAALYSKEHLLEHVMSALPPDIGRDDWLQALPRALVAGFVKADIDFQRKGECHCHCHPDHAQYRLQSSLELNATTSFRGGVWNHGDTCGHRWVHGHSGVGGGLALHPGHAGRRVAAANRGPPPGGECRGAGARHGQRWGSRPSQSLRWPGGKPVQFE
jgi:hypothetical protein